MLLVISISAMVINYLSENARFNIVTVYFKSHITS